MEEIKTIDEKSIFYHMYHSLLRYHFVIPEYYNDFAYWLENILHEYALAEKFANIQIREYLNVEEIRKRLVELITVHLENQKSPTRVPTDGFHEFHFAKSICVVYPTKYSASNLEEFLECLRAVDIEVIFYHFFESWLRLGMVEGIYNDDFSRWISESLGHEKLAEKIASLDPLGYTLEDLKEELIRLTEEELRGDK